MGYPNPQQIPLTDDVSFRGICVYVPDKPEYLQALLGSLHGLSQWVVWERDNEQSARRSAELWGLANMQTLATWATDCQGCGEMAFDCETMKDCLIEIAKAISVNVTVNNSCGGGDESTFYCVNDDGTITINPPPVSDTGTPPATLPPDINPVPVVEPGDGEPPDGWETWEDFDASACNAANAYVDTVIKSFRFFDSFIGRDLPQMTVLVISVTALLSGGLANLFSRATILLIGEVLYELLQLDWLGDEFEEIAQWIEENRQELVCLLYTKRGNLNGAYLDFLGEVSSYVSGKLDDVEAEGYVSWLYRLMLNGDVLQYFMRVESPSGENYVSCAECEYESDGSWDVVYTQRETSPFSAYTEQVNVAGRWQFVGGIYRPSSFVSAQIYGRWYFPPGTFTQSPVVFTVMNNNESGGSCTVRFNRDLGIQVAGTNAVNGENSVEITNPSQLESVWVAMSWPYTQSDIKDLDFSIRFDGF